MRAAFSRSFQHLAPQKPQPKESKPIQNQPPSQASSKTAQSLVADNTDVSNSEQRRRDWSIIRRLAVNLWPKNDWGTRGRVLLGVGFLVTGKVGTTFTSQSRWDFCLQVLHLEL